MKNIIFKGIIVFQLLLSGATGFAQRDALPFENYSSEQGLSQNSGYAITQDKQGFIWIGTQDGLNRFDGIRFKIYRNNPADSSSIPFNEISSLITDSKGNIWAGGPLGTAVYDPVTDEFASISDYYHTDTALDRLSVQKLFRDRSDNVWILSRYNGLLQFDRKANLIKQFLYAEEISDQLTGIAQDTIGSIWVSAADKIFHFENGRFVEKFSLSNGNPASQLVTSDLCVLGSELWIGTLNDGVFVQDIFSMKAPKHLVAGENEEDLSSNNIKCLYRDHQNNIWIGTRNRGICKYIPQDELFVKGKHSFFSSHSLTKNFILSIFQDNQGIIWTGLSGGGLAKYDPGKFQFNTYSQTPGTENTLPDNMIFCLYGKNDNQLLAGTQNGGLVEIDFLSGKFTSYCNNPSQPHSIVNNTVYSITEDESGSYWLATWGGLCSYSVSNKQKPFNNYSNSPLTKYLYSLVYLPKAGCLLASGPNGIFQFNLQTRSWQDCRDKTGFLQKNKIVGRYFLPDTDSTVWIATEGLGLIRYNYSSGLFTQMNAVYATAHNIRHIYAEGSRLWLGSDNGLILFDVASEKVLRTWKTENGLPNDVVYAILKDQRGKIWLSTNNGLSCYDPVTNQFKNYDVGYGLQGMEFNTASCYADRRGNLYFGGVNGFSKFDPLQMIPNSYASNVKITSVQIFNEELGSALSFPFVKKIALDHDQNFLTLSFTALNFSHTDKNTYAYRLEGVDEKWIEAGNRNFASYTQLPAGNYLFRVKARNSDGKWSAQETTLDIVVQPPFWLSWWFKLGLLVLLGLTATALWRTKATQIRKEERVNADFNRKIAHAETAALRAQMNPHFIFNTLNSINSYIMDNNPRVASNYLTKFARLIRIILDNSKNETITLSKEIETLKLYLLMEGIRFNNKFDYEIRIDSDVDTDLIKIPPMIIQPYAENAIWHGLMHKSEKGKVSIAMSLRSNGVLEVRISDNGIGREKAMGLKSKASNENKSYGIKITRDRLQMNNELNDVQVLDVTDEEGEAAGTTVILSIKI